MHSNPHRLWEDIARSHVLGPGGHSNGAEAYGTTDSPLSDGFPPVLPYRGGGSAPDAPGTFKSDTITTFAVPRNGTLPVGTTYWIKSDNTTGTYQLMVYETTGSADVPVIDHVVALSFEYSGDPLPPTLRKPLADPVGPWTTYGPKPAATAVPPFAARENCVFVDEGSPAPQPRLATLGSPESLVALSSSLLTDGPWCPSDAAPDRWDADLLRVRTVAVVVRVQSAIAALRGPANALFLHGGTSRGGHNWVPDLEARFQISPRNLNRGR